jgi:hypothetical protein
MFDVTPFGFAYYRRLKERDNEPTQRIEVVVRSYLEAGPFRRSYREAFSKLARAEKLLWEENSNQKLTTIGHLCREALQEFAAVLIERYSPPNAPPDKAAVTPRIRCVLELQTIGHAGRAILDALLEYWRAVVDLAQRQEHGAQKEGKALVWEDGRRLVFQAAVLMYEIDRALD